jgi:hypothetical protein
MTTPILTDPKVFPSQRVLARHLGKRAPLWESFTGMVASEHPDLAVEWQYYRDGSRWLCKVNRKKKTMCWISVWPGFFKVTFYLGSKNDAAVANAKIDPRLKRAFLQQKGRTTFRPLMVEVKTKAALKDVGELLRLKKRLA